MRPAPRHAGYSLSACRAHERELDRSFLGDRLAVVPLVEIVSVRMAVAMAVSVIMAVAMMVMPIVPMVMMMTIAEMVMMTMIALVMAVVTWGMPV